MPAATISYYYNIHAPHRLLLITTFLTTLFLLRVSATPPHPHSITTTTTTTQPKKNGLWIYNNKADSDNAITFTLLVKHALQTGIHVTDILLCPRIVSYDYSKYPREIARKIMDMVIAYSGEKKMGMRRYLGGKGDDADLKWVEEMFTAER